MLDASLALVAFDDAAHSARGGAAAGRPVVHLPLDRALAAEGAVALASALRALVLAVAPRAEAERREIAARTAQERSLLGSALGELRWAARELGLAEPPSDALALVAALFGETR